MVYLQRQKYLSVSCNIAVVNKNGMAQGRKLVISISYILLHYQNVVSFQYLSSYKSYQTYVHLLYYLSSLPISSHSLTHSALVQRVYCCGKLTRTKMARRVDVQVSPKKLLIEIFGVLLLAQCVAAVTRTYSFNVRLTPLELLFFFICQNLILDHIDKICKHESFWNLYSIISGTFLFF